MEIGKPHLIKYQPIEQHCGGQGCVVGVGAAQAVGPADGGGGRQGVCQEEDGQGDGHFVVEARGGDGAPQHCDGEVIKGDVMMVDSWEVGVWLKEEGPKYPME